METKNPPDNRSSQPSQNPQPIANSTDTDPMLIEERRRLILTMAQKEGRVRVRELSKTLGISQITVRKDLDYLQKKGKLQRSHGGAIPVQPGALFDPPLEEKEMSHHHEKERIARAAAAMVQDGQCVMLDSGTTTTAIARALKKFSHLTIITNAVNIAAELTGTGFEVILTGGILRQNSFSLVGPLAEEMLAEMHADILFLGVDGFDTEVGLTTPNMMEARVNRLMVQGAGKVVAVCDSSKFDRRSLARIAPPTALHHVITDGNAPAHVLETLGNLNIGVTLV